MLSDFNAAGQLPMVKLSARTYEVGTVCIPRKVQQYPRDSRVRQYTIDCSTGHCRDFSNATMSVTQAAAHVS